ncbi:hypothetical protein NPIL_430001 [Nephila pilipes]|uniref:Uncharacterized protein n=1 Tax=Nephila pilipes TaxID=299642 RepID=A0A8X6ULJ4_NEPPI|nr:hypothetical protein NPIL_430001 [Nephila pilipes]
MDFVIVNDRGMRVPQPRLPKIVRPNHPRFVDEAAVSRSKCNERPPTGRAPFLIRASPTPRMPLFLIDEDVNRKRNKVELSYESACGNKCESGFRWNARIYGFCESK